MPSYTPPGLRIYCFGTLRVELDGKPVVTFETDKTRALLVYLAVESSRPHRREHLAGLLWSDIPEKRALQNLRQTILYLRKALCVERSAAPCLIATRDEVQLNPAFDTWLDVSAFSSALDEAYCHYQRRSGHGWLNIRLLQRGLAQVKGDFLEQFYLGGSPLFDEWASLQREEYNRRTLEALALLADYYQRRSEYELARQTTLRIVELAPWEETAQAQMMRLLAMDKQWSAAQNQYAILRRYLRDQVGVEPSQATLSLFDEIRTAATQNKVFPPNLPLARHNLPNMPTPFVGRDADLDYISKQLSDPECRLLTLLGPGGIGKTRLALEAARDQVGITADGVFFVPLVSVNSREQIPSAIADALGLVFSERGDPQTQLLEYLRQKQILLVLDNFEHLLAAQGSTNLLSEVLRQASGIKLMVTTRERLHLQEECVYTLEGMAYPARDDTPLEASGSFDALNLFERLAQQVHGNFFLDTSNLSSIIRICQLLDGLPLGVELAAAASWDCTCAEIARRIAQGFDELTTYASNVPPRHRSLHAAFDVSWQLLTAAQQHVFCCLSAFRGGFEISAIQALLEDTIPLSELHPLLSALVEKSLLRRTPTGRYELHEAIRQYAAGRLSGMPELSSAIQAKHARYYADLIANQTGSLKSSNQANALNLIHPEIENTRCAWEWLVSNRCTVEISHCVESIFLYFNIRSQFTEGIELFQQAVHALEGYEAGILARGMCLSRLGALAYRARNHTLAQEALDRSLEIFNRLDEPSELAFCQIYSGGVMMRKANYNAAQALAQNSLALYRTLGDEWGESYALYFLSLVKNRTGRFEEALPLSAEAVAVSRRLGNPHRLIAPLNLLGDIACVRGDYETAESHFLESLEISRALNDLYNQAILLNNLATVYQAKQQYDQERAVFEASLALCREIGDQDGEAIALNGLGEMAVHLEEYAQAIQFSQQALQVASQATDAWTSVVCLNNLGEAYCGIGENFTAEAHLQQALQAALKIQALDLVARTAVLLGRVYQQRGENSQAIRFMQAALAHPAIDDETRTKGMRWLSEMGADVNVDSRAETLDEVAASIIH
jgi:predicted ATPase/DNA-binding SARP family transcriptional activator/tetratricopeptide (TPR) repeat protein